MPNIRTYTISPVVSVASTRSKTITGPSVTPIKSIDILALSSPSWQSTPPSVDVSSGFSLFANISKSNASRIQIYLRINDGVYKHSITPGSEYGGETPGYIAQLFSVTYSQDIQDLSDCLPSTRGSGDSFLGPDPYDLYLFYNFLYTPDAVSFSFVSSVIYDELAPSTMEGYFSANGLGYMGFSLVEVASYGPKDIITAVLSKPYDRLSLPKEYSKITAAIPVVPNDYYNVYLSIILRYPLPNATAPFYTSGITSDMVLSGDILFTKGEILDRYGSFLLNSSHSLFMTADKWKEIPDRYHTLPELQFTV